MGSHMIEIEPGADWKQLQKRVAAILSECGLDAAVEKTLQLARGSVEIDVLATDPTTSPPALYLCECKRWQTSIPQAEVQTFRTIVSDSGAHFGLFVAARGFQAGAQQVVQHTNIHLLDWNGFQNLFLERWCRQYWVPTLRTQADRMAAYVDPPMSDAAIRYARDEQIDPAEAIGLFVLDLHGPPFAPISGAFAGTPSAPIATAIWEHRDRYRAFLPHEATTATCLRGLLNALISFSRGSGTARSA
jgi:restriction system protein